MGRWPATRTSTARGFAPGGRRADPKPGKFYVAVFAPDGKTRRFDVDERADSRFLHARPTRWRTASSPIQAGGTLVVRLRDPDINQGGETWRVYELSTGDRLATVDAPRPIGQPAT